jgi:ArsR family transcriptional regulator
MSDPTRVRLALLLEKEELSVAELQQIVGRGQSQISTHLAQLRASGLVQDRREGKNTFYSLGAAAKALLPVLHQSAKEIPETGDDDAALKLTLERRRDRMRAYFDSLAGRFGREYLPGRSWQGLAEALLSILPPLVIADLGAGEGTFSQLLARRAKRVVAVDSSERMIQFGAELAARHGVDNLEFRLGDMEACPIGDAEVDLVFFSQSLHHSQHPERAIGEAFRILKAGGQIAILDLVRHQFEQARELYADTWLGFSEVELRRFLADSGFSGVETRVVHRETEPPFFETLLAVGRR